MGVYSLVAALVCLLALLNLQVQGHQLESRELTIADIPACGLRCLSLVLPSSRCEGTDSDCICASDSLEYNVAACLLANCTMQDSLDTSRVQGDLCNLSDESKTQGVIFYTSIVYSIAFLSVVLRVAGKAVSKRLAWDDAVVVAALLLTAIPLGCVIDMALKGFGEHLWNLEDGKLLPIVRNLYISWSTYVVVLCMIKISLVLLYLGIFKTRRFQISAYVFLAYLVVNSSVIFFIIIFACNPVPSFWNRDIKGKCIDIQAAAYANSASAIVQDIILLILPLVFIRNLQMKRRRKIAVGTMFIIGTFGCIAAIMRLPSLNTFKMSIDPSWDYVPITVWTEFELAAGFLCVSLPSIRVLFFRMLPKRVKDCLSNIAHHFRNRSDKRSPTPQQAIPPEQRKWSKPNSWIDISANTTGVSNESMGKDLEPLTLGSGVRGTFMSAFWNRSSTQSTRFSESRTGHERLGSAVSIYSVSGIAVTRPPYHEQRSNSPPDEVAMLTVQTKSNRHKSTSEEQITALPRICCIPRVSDSRIDVIKTQPIPAAQWQYHEKDMV
ncbi:uncharacterized protein M421DRAFT_71288 [Didymella exigua CBS 183.55]|uniref:CFEM domain-containing protein n=1 Tax=Didymella exigua CBS 183.55 TaxID=1150837 RepID=A0A6A5RBD8_9PLEO|nr:uncharacterized protein M421DRAFT_71288 [Didymella exigua CBS 183.55]KAF1924962.1 hypothetical protein M421DRAFT_71288 [Didymella exigua CBS 183.55]